MKQNKKILILALHRLNRSPGQRYRFESFLQFFNEYGYDYELSYLLNEKEDKIFYGKGNYVRKIWIVIRSFLKRWKQAGNLKQYDLIYLFRDTQFLGNTIAERKMKRSGVKMVFDFDDAIFIKDMSEGNKLFSFVKNPDKISKIISLCDAITAGNNFLADYAKQYNNHVKVIPSVVDTDWYQPKEFSAKEKICIGWTGSTTTIKHFELILPVFIQLKKKYGDKIYFKIIGDENYRNEELKIKGEKWSAQTEVSDLSEMDIGIMPMPDDEWSKGKCSMKGLQYMGMGIPAAMSNVGMNREVIEDGVNGFLCSSNEEWLEKLSTLIENADLRRSFGIAGRKTVEEKFSIHANKEKFFAVLNELTK